MRLAVIVHAGYQGHPWVINHALKSVAKRHPGVTILSPGVSALDARISVLAGKHQIPVILEKDLILNPPKSWVARIWRKWFPVTPNIVDAAEAVLVFWDHSREALQIISRAHDAGRPVWIVHVGGKESIGHPKGRVRNAKDSKEGSRPIRGSVRISCWGG